MWLSGKESACQCEMCEFDLWVRKIPWRRKWQPIPLFLPGKSHGQRRLEGYSPWGHKESDMTERLSIQAPPHTSRDEYGFLGKVTAKENTHTHTHTHTHTNYFLIGLKKTVASAATLWIAPV